MTRGAVAAALALSLSACAGSRLAPGSHAPRGWSGSASDAFAMDVAPVAAAPVQGPPCGAPVPPCCPPCVPDPCGGFEVSVRVRAWWACASGDLLITRGSEPGSGTTADLQDDLGLCSSVEPTVGVDLRCGRHRLRLAWERLAFCGSETLDEDVIFRGTTFPAGEDVDSWLCLTLWEAGYQYAVVATPCTEVWVGAGAWWWSFSSELDGESGLSESRSFSHVLPIATVDAVQRWGNFSLHGGIHGGLLDDDRYAIDLEASVGWRFWGPFELEAGWRWMRFAFHEATNEMDATFTGPFVGLSASFYL